MLITASRRSSSTCRRRRKEEEEEKKLKIYTLRACVLYNHRHLTPTPSFLLAANILRSSTNSTPSLENKSSLLYSSHMHLNQMLMLATN